MINTDELAQMTADDDGMGHAITSVSGYPKMFRGRRITRIPVTDVRIGDRLCCWLSDASAYPQVTGWSDKTIDLTRHGLGVHIQRHFTASDAPWWAKVTSAGTDVDDLTFGRDETCCILARQ